MPFDPDAYLAGATAPAQTGFDPDAYLAGSKSKSMFDKVSDFFTGDDRETRATRELPELGSGGLLSNQDPATLAKVAASLAVTLDPREMGQILSTIPGIGITEDEKGNLIANNNKTGAQVVINQPGMSKLDAMQLIGLGAMYTPAGKAVGAASTLGKKVLTGAAALGTTEAAIQSGQEAAGGEFDVGDVALMTGAGVAAPLVAPIAKAAAPLVKEAVKKVAPAVAKGAKTVVKSAAKGAKAVGKVPGKLWKVGQNFNLIPANKDEFLAQIAGHYIAPGFGGPIAQRLVKRYANLAIKSSKKSLSKSETKVLSETESKLKALKAKAVAKKARRDAHLQKKQAEAAKKGK